MLYRLTKDLIFRNYCRKDPRNKSLYVSNSIFSYFIHLIWKPISAFRFLLKYIHCFQIQSFISGWKFCFQNQSFVSSFLFQYEFQVTFPELKFCFWNQSFHTRSKASILERNLQIWVEITIWIQSFKNELF